MRKLFIMPLVFAAIFGCSKAHAATAPSFSIAGRVVAENVANPVLLTITKSAKATSYSKVRVYSVTGGTCAANRYKPLDVTLQFANNTLTQSAPFYVIDNSDVDGNCTVNVKISAVRFATIKTAQAQVQIRENDTAPPPPLPVTWKDCVTEGGVCYVVGTANVRYGSGTTWTAPRSVTGSIACDNATWGDPLVGVSKVCQTDGTVGSQPDPNPLPDPTTKVCPDGSIIPIDQVCPTVPVPNGQWYQLTGDPVVGGYAMPRNQGACCNGLIVQVSRTQWSNDADPTKRQLLYWGYYVSDPSGNFPPLVGTDYWTKYEFGGWTAADLWSVGLRAPAPAIGQMPTYGDTVKAIQACVGQTVPDALTVGQTYKVVGLQARTTPGRFDLYPYNLPEVAALNPTVDDGKHRGDGWYAYTVPMTCIQKAEAALGPPLLFRAPEKAPTKLLPNMPIATATKDCRDLFNAKNPQNEDYNMVVKGQRYGIQPAKEPGTVFAVPMNRALGTIHASENCFK